MFDNVKLVVFDLMGVIFVECHIVRNILFPMLPEPKDYDAVKKQYLLLHDGSISTKDFWKNINIKDYKDFQKKYLDKIKLDQNYVNVIDQLKTKYKLGILSNLPLDFAKYLTNKHNFKNIFSLILVSGKTGFLKPKTEPYKLLIKKTKLPAEQVVFIDDRKNNLVNAKKFGIKTIRYNRESDELKFNPDKTIKNSRQLLKIL